MFNWLIKLYLLIRGDRFARDKLDEVKDLVYSLDRRQEEMINQLTVEVLLIKKTLEEHIKQEFENTALINERINNFQFMVELNNKFLENLIKKNA